MKIWMQPLNMAITAVAMLLNPVQPGTYTADVAGQNNEAAFALYGQIASSSDENVFISPFSISTALAMTYAGAAGSTANEMAKTLYFGENNEAFHKGYGAYLEQLKANAEGHIELRVANRLWAESNYRLIPEFLDVNARAYQSPLQLMNFSGQAEQSRIRINDWVADNTENKILDLLPSGAVNESTRLVLTNAVYFKADWLHAFDMEKTRKRDFKKSNGAEVNHDFMHKRHYFRYMENDELQAIQLPYKGDKHSMVILLPHAGISLETLEAKTGAATLAQLMRSHSQEVDIALPKFKMILPLSLKEHLKAMGMKEAFAEGANFSKMSPDNDLCISEVIHKAFIEIDEEGTEAAAATAVVMMQTSSAMPEPRMPKIFVADRPFLFYIVDNRSKAILFMGRLVDPAAA